MTPDQLLLLATARSEERFDRAVEAQRHLLLMACSQRKSGLQARAIDLYKGVMYQTYNAHVKEDAMPRLMILSAEYGFLWPWDTINTYDRKMDDARAEEMLSDIEALVHKVLWPDGLEAVQLCGGAAYRRVMTAAVDVLKRRGCISAAADVRSLSGGIGEQRAQLGAFLDNLTDPLDIIGRHPNRTPLYRELGERHVGERVHVAYNPPRTGTITELFHGPRGPTASVEIDAAPRCRAHPGWVGLADLAPIIEQGMATGGLRT